MSDNFFPPRPDSHPLIYAYEIDHPSFRGLLKIGYTEKSADERIRQQVANITLPQGKQFYKIVFTESAMRNDGSCFTDHEVHAYLKKYRKDSVQHEDGEWNEYIGDTRTVDVHIKRIREKLPDNETWRVFTVWGVGYKFEDKRK